MGKKRNKLRQAVPQPLPHERPINISTQALWEAGRNGRTPVEIGQVFARPAPFPGTMPAMAMDSLPVSFNSGQFADWTMQGVFNEGLAFLGYPYLAQLAQRAEYRRPAEIWAEHCTRKWIKLRGPEEKLKQLETFMGENDENGDDDDVAGLRVRSCIREVIEQDGIFGRSQIFLDFDDADEFDELLTPLMISKAKISQKRPLKRLKVVEPMWSYPAPYNSTNPLAQDFYKPNGWYVYGNTISDSRLLTFVSREVPDMLKPAYAFGGLSLTQMIKPYVDNWIQTRQSVNDLVQAFSQMVLKTDTSSIMSDAGALFRRVDFFNRTRNNRGTMVIGEDETLENIAVPLSSLDKLQSQAQEHMAACSGIPLVILLGITPEGLNASSQGEIQSFYAAVKAMQEKVIAPNLTRLINICQLSLWGAIDPKITYEFIDLWEMDEKDKALIRKDDATAHAAYVAIGAVDNEEVRQCLENDETGLYHGVDLSGPAPEPEPEDKPGVGAEDGWSESDHPRDEIGRFGSSNKVHEAGEEFRQHFKDMGHSVGEISHSTNRHGESSSYFEVSQYGRMRVSDHSANQNFRINETSTHHELVSREQAEKIVREMDENARTFKETQKSLESEQDTKDLPFALRFAAAKPHEQDAIVLEAYPAASNDKQWKRRIRESFTKIAKAHGENK